MRELSTAGRLGRLRRPFACGGDGTLCQRARRALRLAFKRGRLSREQIDSEKKRVYAPLAYGTDGADCKELNAAVARVMQNYRSESKNAELLSLARI